MLDDQRLDPGDVERADRRRIPETRRPVERHAPLQDQRDVVGAGERDDAGRSQLSQLGEPLDPVHAGRDASYVEPAAPPVEQLGSVAPGAENDSVRGEDREPGIAR